MNTLKDLNELTIELNTSNSKLDKIAILKKHPQCKEILSIVYDPLIKFNVTSANVLKRYSDHKTNYPHENIFYLLDDLSKRVITGHQAIDCCIDFINNNLIYKDLILNILDKQLKCRIDEKSINKAFPDCIKTFEVALAKSYADHSHQVDFENEEWFSEPKLDGCRNITIVNGDNVSFYSREGNEFKTLDNLKEEILKIKNYLNLDSFVLDGEICIIENGKENFKSIVSQIKRKDYTIPNPHYMIFDILDINDFNNHYSSKVYKDRYNELCKLKNISQSITVIDAVLVKNESHFTQLIAAGKTKGWEGLILRNANSPYEGKRSRNLLKVKQFIDEEFKIVNYEVGPFRIIDQTTKLEKTIDTLTNIIISLKGNVTCSVGSGFTLEERDYWYNNKEKLIGKIATVQYFERTQDKNGNERLRFPTIKMIYDGKRDI